MAPTPMTPNTFGASGIGSVDQQSTSGGQNNQGSAYYHPNASSGNQPIMAPASVLGPAPTPLAMPFTPHTPFIDESLRPLIQNIVCTVNLGCKLDLKNIALHARNAEYNPKRFAAVIMRIRQPRTTALVFSSGKMVCTGAKSMFFF